MTPERLVHKVVAGVVMFILFRFAILFAAAIAFPMGGREFHAMFAYSASGRIGTAILVYGVYVGALSACAVVLRVLQNVFSATGIARVASMAGTISWWPVCVWPVQSAAFRVVAVAGLLTMPWVMYRVCRVMSLRWRRSRLREWG